MSDVLENLIRERSKVEGELKVIQAKVSIERRRLDVIARKTTDTARIEVLEERNADLVIENRRVKGLFAVLAKSSGVSLGQVGEWLGVGKERARQTIAGELRRLRSPAIAKMYEGEEL